LTAEATHDGPHVAIVGGGPSGLAAALTLSRSMIRTTVIETEDAPRNGASPFVASLPGFDRRQPAEVRDAIRRDISQYPYARFRQAKVTNLDKCGSRFTLTMDRGDSVTADAVLLATGMIDLLPPLHGLAGYWGHSIINCPFCHGIEWQNSRWGIYVDRPEVMAAAEIYRNWSDRITYFIGPGSGADAGRLNELESLGISVEMSLPERAEGKAGTLTHVILPDGRHVALDCLLVYPQQRLPDLVAHLEIARTEAGHVAIDDGYRSSMAGVYAAGDLVYQGHQNTPTALHMGNMAAATMVMDICFKSRSSISEGET